MVTNTFKIRGPVHGYARGEGIKVRAFSYKNDKQAKLELKNEVARMENDLGAKVSVIGAGKSVPESFLKHIETYECDLPDWTVPHMQVHFGIPARDLPDYKASAPDEPASKPASKKRASKRARKVSSYERPKAEDNEPIIQADLFEQLKKIGGG